MQVHVHENMSKNVFWIHISLILGILMSSKTVYRLVALKLLFEFLQSMKQSEHTGNNEILAETE